MRAVVLDAYTANRNDLSWKELEELCAVTFYDWTEPGGAAERLAGAVAAFTNKALIPPEAMMGLKYIGIMATGYDHIDLGAAKKAGITVTYVPEYASHSVAQHVFALMLELCCGVNEHHLAVTRDKKWSGQRYNSFWLKPIRALNGKTMGIIGMGRIGERVAEIASAFGMNVLAYDVNRRETPHVKWASLEELLRQSDVVSAHCPLLPQTEGMINKNSLSIMKNTAYFINTSRGGLVAEKDLADALNGGVIAGAALDVLAEEPPSAGNPLLSAKNIVITPHIGWASVEARQALIHETALNFKAFLNGEKRNALI